MSDIEAAFSNTCKQQHSGTSQTKNVEISFIKESCSKARASRRNSKRFSSAMVQELSTRSNGDPTVAAHHLMKVTSGGIPFTLQRRRSLCQLGGESAAGGKNRSVPLQSL